MPKAVLTFLLVLLNALPAAAAGAADIDVEALVTRMDTLMRGRTSSGRYEMIVTAPRWQRRVEMDAWSEGPEKSFIRINYPRRDRGITFLRINNEMWQYVPKIEKTMKIPPSLMLQSWMGSDLTNDDMAKESSLVKDYTKRFIEFKGDIVVVELTPLPEAAVVWGRILMEIDRQRLVPRDVLYYDEDDVLIRRVSHQEVERVADRYYPMKFMVEPMLPEKKGRSTVLVVKSISFNEAMPDNLFSIRSLKSLSR